MRKITLFFAALLISMTAFSATLYLSPNANWKSEGARFAAYFYGNGETWISMADSNSDGVYEVEAPAGYPNVIFCRMNPSTTANNWNNKYNQTADLTVPTDNKVKLVVPEGVWDGAGNTCWVELDNDGPVVLPETWTIAGSSSALFGSEWAPGNETNDLTEGEGGVWTKVYDDVTLPAGNIEYKIVKSHVWGEAYPGDNAILNIPTAGVYDVTFTFNVTTHAITATAEKQVVKTSWSFDGGKTAAESGIVLDKFTNVIVAFSGVDSVGRKVTSVAGQGSSTNILFYEVLADGSLAPVENNGLMYPKSSGTTVTYSLQAKNYKNVETGTYNYLRQGNYRIVIDGDAGVAGTGDILFKPNRTGLPKVYNDQTWTFDFTIENDYVARYAQATQYVVVPAYDRYAPPTLLESLSEIVVTFPEYESIVVNATYGDNQTYIPCVVSENGANVEKAQVKWEAVEGTPNVLRLYIDEAVTATGTYGITIPEGLVTFKSTAAEEVYNESIALSYTVAKKNITSGLKLYYDFSAFENLKALTYAGAVLNDGTTETSVDMVAVSEGLWELTVPEGSYYHVTVNLGTAVDALSFGATALYYDGENNLHTLKAEAPYVQWGMAEDGDFNRSVYSTEPEVVPTIVGGTKLYLKSDLGVSSSSAYGYNVVFGEFEVPSSGGSGGSVRPMQQAGSLGGTTTIPGTAMTKVYTKEGKYDIWEVVAPEGTADSIFNIVVSRKGTMISGYITPLKYDGEHNMFMLPENFAFDLRTPIADETAGEWGIYVEGEYSDPDPIVGTWNIEEGAVLESFESATITFTGVESAKAKSTYSNYFFYKVAEDGTKTLVPSMCSDGYMDAAAEGTSVTFSIDTETCYLDMPQYGALFALTTGDYCIEVPAGAIQFNNDATNLNKEAYVLNFHYEAPEPAVEVDAAYTVNPENNATVAEITEIVINFTEYETITVAEPDLASGSNIPTVSIFYEDYGMNMPAGYMMFAADANSANGLRLYVDPAYAQGMESFAVEGVYTITIPAGVVTFADGISKTITLTYTVAEPEPVITAMEAKNAYAYDVVVEANEDLTKATVSYRLNAPAVAVKVQATVNGEVVKEVEGTTVCQYVDGVAENLNTIEVSLEGLAGNVVFQVAVEGTVVETPTEVTKAYQFYHPKGVEVDANPESEFFGRVYATEGMPVAKAGDKYISDVNGNGVGQGLYAFDATLAPIANKDGKYGFTGGLTFNSLNPAGKSDYAPLRVVLSEDGRLFFSRQSVGVSPLVEVNPADLDANFTEVFTGFVCDSTTYDLNTAEGAFMAAPNVGFDVKGTGEDLKVLMLSTKVGGWAAAKSAFRVDEYNLGTATTWSAAPSTAVEALSGQYIVTYTSSNVEYDNEGGMWLIQHRGTPSASEPALVHLNAAGEVDYTNTSINAAASGFAFNADYTLLAFAGNGNQKCTIYEVGKDAEGAPTLTEKYNFATTIGTNLNDIAWDYADNLYIVGNSGEWLKVFALPRESAVVTTPAAERYTVELPLPMEVEFENIAAIYEKGMWDMAYYESYDNNNVKAILKSQPTVVDKVVAGGMMGSMNNYYLNDGTGVIVLQAPATAEIWGEVVEGLEIEVGQKLPADFTATIDFKCVVDEETWLPTGEVYGAPVMTFVSKVIGVDEEGWIIEEPYANFVARCEASDFVEETVEANIDDVLANRMDYAGKLLTLNASANYYAEVMMDHFTGASSTTAYMFWDAEEAFDVETYEEEGTTYVFVSPKLTEDWNNYAGKLFNVNAENLPSAAFDVNATIDVVTARFDWNSIAQGQTLVVKDYEVEVPEENPVDVENGELVVNIYSNNGSVYVETEAGAMIEVYTVNGLRVFAGVSNTNTTVINGLNTNIAIIRVNGETYKVFVK